MFFSALVQRQNTLLCSITFTLLTLFSIAPALAQFGSESPRWFTIELIVFEQTPHPGYAEHWFPSPVLSFPDELVTFPSDSSRHSLPNLFLEEDFNGQLADVAASLQRNRGQRILYARRWHQGLLPRAQAQNIYIAGGDRVNGRPELSGSIAVSVERYLHISANIWLAKQNAPTNTARYTRSANNDNSQAKDGRGEGNRESSAGDFGEQYERDLFDAEPVVPSIPHPPFARGYGGPGTEVGQVYLLQQERRVRSTEVHYIDHPALGIIVRIDPLEQAQED